MKLKSTERLHVAVVGATHGAEAAAGEPGYPGGAARAARLSVCLTGLGCRVFHLSCAGLDSAGAGLINELARRGVNVDFMERAEPAAPGSRPVMTNTALLAARAMISSCHLMAVVPDIPEETFDFALRVARHFGVPVLCAAAPGCDYIGSRMRMLDVLVAGDDAALELSRIRPSDMETAEEAADYFLKKGAGASVIYHGARGATAGCEIREAAHYPAPVREGQFGEQSEDMFAAALCCALTLRRPLPDAATYAIAAAAAAAGAPPDATPPGHREITQILAPSRQSR